MEDIKYKTWQNRTYYLYYCLRRLAFLFIVFHVRVVAIIIILSYLINTLSIIIKTRWTIF